MSPGNLGYLVLCLSEAWLKATRPAGNDRALIAPGPGPIYLVE